MHVEHDSFNLIARLHHFRWMLHAPRPCHLADVNQTLDSGFQLDEGAVIGDVHDSAHPPAIDRILLLYPEPRIRLELLDPERDAAFLAVEFQSLDRDLIT